MLKLNKKINGCYLAEMSTCVTNTLRQILTDEYVRRPIGLSYDMVKVEEGKVYLLNKKDSRPVVSIDVSSNKVRKVDRYSELSGIASKTVIWLDSLSADITKVVFDELKCIHDKFYTVPVNKEAV